VNNFINTRDSIDIVMIFAADYYQRGVGEMGKKLTYDLVASFPQHIVSRTILPVAY